MIKMVDVNDSQFNTLVLKSSLPVLVDCSSPECIICKTMDERINSASREFTSQMVFFRLNVNDNKRWQEYQVRVIPTLLYFKGGELIARQDNFPDTDEIIAQIKSTLKSAVSLKKVPADLKAAYDFESVAAKFYKYVIAVAKNGTVREKFRQLCQETLSHMGFLEKKLREISENPEATFGELGQMEDLSLRPQGFSLAGAMKMALKIEQRLMSLYKKIANCESFGDVDVFKAYAKDEAGHVKLLQKEMKFIRDKEMFSTMESPEYPNWLNKVFG